MAAGSLDSFRYDMNNKARGVGIIINNVKFHPRTQMTERKGSDKDAVRLQDLFETLSFDTQVHHNQTTTQMIDIFRNAAGLDHTCCDAFICAILSHGDDGYVYGTDGVVYLDTLTDMIKGPRCASLAGKPKIFFIQACRGTKLDEGVELADATGDDESAPPRRIPTEADFLMFYSTVPGFYSWRNSNDGSYFIRELVNVFETHDTSTTELMQLLTKVNYRIAYNFESNTNIPQMNKKKQIPSIVSMLTKQLFLAPKE